MSKKPSAASRDAASGYASQLPKAPDHMPTTGMAKESIVSGRSPHDTTYTNSGRGTRGGIDGNYYYAAVSQADRKLPAPDPVRLDPQTGRPMSDGAAGSTKPGGSGPARGGWTAPARHADKDDWEADVDPSLLKDYDPLAAAGTERNWGGGEDVSDPFAVAAGSGGTSSSLESVDPLAACQPCKKGE